MKNKSGFTLAEVLITLVIIGVIAAITVPTLITKYQKEQTVTRLKKAYSALSQTTARAIADNGPIATWEVGQNLSSQAAADFTKKYIEPYLNLAKPTTMDDDTWITMYLSDGTRVRAAIVNTNNEKRLQMNIYIQNPKKKYKANKDGFEYSYYLSYKDYWVGNKKYKKELFIGKFIPFGGLFSRNELLTNQSGFCHKNQSMAACAAVIMKDGWKISDDYPW